MTPTQQSRSVLPFVDRIVARHRAFAMPRPDGLPTRRVLLAFPAILIIFGALFIGLGINGTSSGQMFTLVSDGTDPQLIAGHPQAIRSDEWYVATSWSIAQVQQGLPARNHTQPGGMDAAIPDDLPRLDWSVAFRPQLWGYLVFDVNHAMAWKWWIPALVFLAAAYAFMVTLLPRRPILAAALSVGFYCSPFFQWWFQPAVFLTVGWGLAAMTAMLWAVKDRSAVSRWVWALVVGYLTTVMAMGIYAPFIIPIVYVVGFAAIALIVDQRRRRAPWLAVAGQSLPLLVGGAAGAAVTLLWLHTKAATVNAFLSTAYPGQRLTATGSSNALSFARAVSASFSESLMRGNGFLGANSSEAATFFFVGLFMLPIAGWIVYRSARRGDVLPWAIIGLFAVVLLFVAFFFVPGWNSLAHLLFLDRTTDGRARIGFGLASFALLGHMLRYQDQEGARPGRVLAISTAGLYFLLQFGVATAVLIVEGAARLSHDAPLWWLSALGGSAAIYFFSRRRFALGATAFLLVTVISTITVNPLYRGIFDLRTTAASQEIMRLDREHSGYWLGVGGVEVSALLLESGVHAYNGVQGAPSRVMWHQIDPANTYIFMWNRLAGIGWTPGAGDPVVSNPAADQVLVTFDACAPFAQKHVTYVLSDDPAVGERCLARVTGYPLPGKRLTIYRVVPRP
jgi:hypothetical protein